MLKEGDKVVCINPRPGSSLVKNREYSAVKVLETSYGKTLVRVKGAGMPTLNSFDIKRFELATPFSLENK